LFTGAFYDADARNGLFAGKTAGSAFSRIVQGLLRLYFLSHYQQRGGPNMAKKAATPATVTLKHLAAAIAEEQELSKKQAEGILNDVVSRITKHLKKGDRIRIVGLGILQVRKRAARVGRNPATGEPINIKASKKVAFRAAKELKEAI
jgi:DNA-binding protein HU-beta